MVGARSDLGGEGSLDAAAQFSSWRGKGLVAGGAHSSHPKECRAVVLERQLRSISARTHRR
ncbi:MAG: hypothetical protein CL928_12995 [Deltaproteobacteria bacterium]|nr:hypothetical protein [Deltaproteobacteria bacterium]